MTMDEGKPRLPHWGEGAARNDGRPRRSSKPYFGGAGNETTGPLGVWSGGR